MEFQKYNTISNMIWKMRSPLKPPSIPTIVKLPFPHTPPLPPPPPPTKPDNH